jgi:hypothetical protein
MASLRRVILEYLSHVGADHRWGRGRDYLFGHIKQQMGGELTPQQLMEALWLLASEGLVYVDYTQDAPTNWRWALTERGSRLAASTDEYEPDDPEGYLKSLRANVSDLDELVLLYAQEALAAYQAGCYLASSVMLGVASERTFQLLGEACAPWLPELEERKFREVFDSARRNYVDKFVEFRRRIEPKKGDLPAEFSDNMELTLNSVLDLLRIARNEAGHPTGRRFDRDEAYINLQVFARYLRKLYSLRAFFLTQVRERSLA